MCQGCAIPSGEGQITEIALYWPYGNRSPEDTGVRKSLEQLCSVLGHEAVVYVLGCPAHTPRTPGSTDRVIWVPGGHTAAVSPKEKAVWVQDAVAMVRHPESGCRKLLLRPEKTGVHREHYLQLAHACGAGLGLAYPGFEGGNHLFGQGWVMAGYDVLCKLAAAAGKSPAAVHDAATHTLRQTWGVEEVIWIGGSASPAPAQLRFPFRPAASLQVMYHLDLFLLAGGKNEAGEQEIWVAETDPSLIHGLPACAAPDIRLLAACLDKTAAFLERHPRIPFRIHRMPLPGFVERDQLKLLPWCNGWAAFHPRGKQYILPDYTSITVSARGGGFIREMQQEAEKRISGTGGRVSWLDLGFEQADERMGALHCMTQVLNREY